MSVAASPVQKIEDGRQSALRAKIALVCHLVRWLTGGYLLFAAWGLYDHWSDGDRVQRVFKSFYKLDISGAAPWQWRAAEAVSALDWIVLAILCWHVWRLFGRYLQGEIFTAESASLLKRIGVLGLFTVAFDFAMRPVTVMLMGAHLTDSSSARHAFVRTEDVLYVVISLVLVALGMIYRSAAELADENAQIV
ncbi:MAG: DUF2975 domain-containing protein [Rhodoblastus sp.]|nr:DUF2975 domain-containing protein [Rhodoblastus sp.]